MNLQPTHLHSSLIKLMPLQSSHFEDLYAAASDPAIWEQHPSRDRYKRDVFQQFFDSAILGKAAFAVIDVENENIIGSSRYYEYNSKNRSVAIGYTFLAKAYWGGRYNQSLKKLMLDYAFEFVDTVIFHIGEHNLRSQIATQRLGARKLERVEEKLYATLLIRNFVYELKKEDWVTY